MMNIKGKAGPAIEQQVVGLSRHVCPIVKGVWQALPPHSWQYQHPSACSYEANVPTFLNKRYDCIRGDQSPVAVV